ncbi:MAG: AsmA family protein [Bacteroidales bacterium]|jgi:hypothetical protein|nr:AsmA family protein [Bacteroidales bacterium]
MKKFLKIFLIAIAALFLILLLTPFLFKGKLMEIAKTELNKMLSAQVDFSDLKLSFIRNFPDAYISLEDLSVAGAGEFEGDTLVAFKKFAVTVDIKSVIAMKNIMVKSVLLDNAQVYARVSDSGHVNWDIVKPSDTPEETADTTSTDTDIKISLKHFEIRNTHITYRDDSSKMEATAKNLNFLLKGDMTMDNVDLSMQLDIVALDFVMDGVRMLRNAHVNFVSEIAADLKNMAFTFKDNRFSLNDIVLNFSGSVNMPGNDIVTDVTFATERTDFKSLLSLIPAIYMTDFENVQTTGELLLDGYVKGTYNDKQMPCISVNLKVDNAMFRYPGLPKSVDKIDIALKAFYDGEVFDRTTLDIDRFHFEPAGNPFDMNLHVKTPESDLHVAGAFKGKIDFNSIADIIPLDSTTLSGVITCDLSLDGRMSTIEKEQYEDFHAQGMLHLMGFNFANPDFPQGIKIAETQLDFSPKIVELSKFNAVIGRTDLSVKGSLENFIPYVFTDATIHGELSLVSNTIDLNEWMTDSGSDAETQDTVPLSVIEVPKNIDFSVNANIANVYFDKLDISRVAGILLIKDGKVTMDKLAMNLLEGSMLLSGAYNTQDVAKPIVDLKMDISRFDIPSALTSLSMLAAMFPEPQDYSGKVSATLSFESLLDKEMSPVLNTILSEGQLQTHGIEIRNFKMLGTLADVLKNDKWRTVSPSDMTIKFLIEDGRVKMREPLQFSVHEAKITMTGDQGLDMTLNYNLKATVPTAAAGATDLLKSIPGGASIKELSLTGIVGGTVTKPDIKFSIADMMGNITGAVKEQVTQKVEEVKEQAREEVAAQVDKIMAEANAKIDALRSSAKQLADKTRAEANNAAGKLENEAASKNAIEKRLAKAAADKLRQEGETKAKQIEQEAEKQAESLLKSAQQQADAIKNK